MLQIGSRHQVIKQYLENLLSLFLEVVLRTPQLWRLVSCPTLVHPLSCNFLGMAVPAVQKMQNEGESGRKQINNYTRMLTIAICALQAPSYLNLIFSW